MKFPFSRRNRIFEGGAKDIFEGPEPGTLIQYFKDDVTDNVSKKSGVITGKGVLNNRISEHLMDKLNNIGIPTHFIRRINMREQLIREVEVIPVQVTVHNIAAGDFAKRLGLEEGSPLPRSIIEFFHKNPEANNPMVSEEHITAFGWASPHDLDDMMALALRTNDYLSGLFAGVGLKLVDFRLEFGRFFESEDIPIIITDEISPDNCHLWDAKTNEKMDKDRFSEDLGKAEEAYQEVARRLGILIDTPPTDNKKKSNITSFIKRAS